ncbi:MAG: extracellular matrix regulator RemB [Ruminococcus sp.]
MYLHLGKNTVIKTKDIVGIFDMDTSTISKNTRDYLAKAEKAGRVINVSTELPKSFVVCMDKEGIKVYISQISSQTLQKRNFNFLKEV